MDIKLHLGCGPKPRKGWTNIDINPKYGPDIVASAEDLNMFLDGSVTAIESCHMFEHFTYYQALSALKEWYRVLEKNGKVLIELPDFNNCIKIMGKFPKTKHGFDLGMAGIFGSPVCVKRDGIDQIHKWGWTFESISKELKICGFKKIKRIPITQTWRVATKTGRDMRVLGIK